MGCRPPDSSVFMGFPGQEYWSGLPFPSPGDLPNPGIEPMSPAVADRFFTTEPPGKPSVLQFMGSQRVRYNLATEQQHCNKNYGSGKPGDQQMRISLHLYFPGFLANSYCLDCCCLVAKSRPTLL